MLNLMGPMHLFCYFLWAECFFVHSLCIHITRLYLFILEHASVLSTLSWNTIRSVPAFFSYAASIRFHMSSLYFLHKGNISRLTCCHCPSVASSLKYPSCLVLRSAVNPHGHRRERYKMQYIIFNTFIIDSFGNSDSVYLANLFLCW